MAARPVQVSSGDEKAERAGDTGGGSCGSSGFGNTFLLPVCLSAGHLCSVAPKAQLGPTGVSQETDSKLKLRAGLLSDKSTALGLGQP